MANRARRDQAEFASKSKVLFRAIEQRNIANFQNTLNTMREFHVHWLCFACDETHSLIHACAYHNQYEILVELIKYFKTVSMAFLRCHNDQYKFELQQYPRPGMKEPLTDNDMKLQVDLLVQKWVNQVTLDNNGWTALHLAIQY